MEILRIENLSFKYPAASGFALKNINLSVNSGDFVLLCGESGCGKTTLMRLMKPEIAPFGEISGAVYYNGSPAAQTAPEIGYVMQSPENQIVTDTVWHELAFGLENVGVPTEVIRRRVGEMASYFGIHNWFRKRTDELSGGEKQLLNLASVMVMQPKILILDEPTGQLDPIAASGFISTVKKLNRETGLTVIIAEHRLEEALPIADRVIIMEDGRKLLEGPPNSICAELYELNREHPMIGGLPSAVRIYNGLKQKHPQDTAPLTVRDGKDYLERNYDKRIKVTLPEIRTNKKEVAIKTADVRFRYGKDLPDILRGISFTVYKGEHFCLLGGNGSGKSTALALIAGLKRPYHGKIYIGGKNIVSYRDNDLYRCNLAFLPQSPQAVFIKDNVYDDFAESSELFADDKASARDQITDIAKKLAITHLLDKHPYDLSGGEQQKCALAKALLSKPKILLLDEPTKGLDPGAKAVFRDIISHLTDDGITVLTVTHDVEFAAECADRCALLFDGEILSEESPQVFFSENNFYTTAANRIARQLFPNAVTCKDVVEFCTEADALK